MNKSILGLTNEDNEKIAANYPGGEHDFYHQDLDDSNMKDAKEWFDKGEMVGIVSEKHGGIIGYIHHQNADDIISILNLYTIDRFKKVSTQDKTLTQKSLDELIIEFLGEEIVDCEVPGDSLVTLNLINVNYKINGVEWQEALKKYLLGLGFEAKFSYGDENWVTIELEYKV